MISLMPSELYVCGPLSEVRKQRRIYELLIGVQVFALYDSEIGKSLSRGSYVRMLAHPEAHGDRYEIVVLQAEGHDPRYVGHFVSWPALALSIALLGIGYRAQNPIIYALGLALGAIYMWFLWRRQYDFQSFAAHTLRAGQAADTAAPPASTTSRREQSPVERRLAELDSLEFAHDALIGWDLKSGAIVYWNKGASFLHGCSRAEALTKARSDFPSAWKGEFDGIVSELRAERTWVGAITHRRADGSELHVHTRLMILSGAFHEPIVAEMSWISWAHSHVHSPAVR
jgi:PAS domain-containing protein